MDKAQVGDWYWLGEKYFDLPAGELIEVYRDMGTDCLAYAFRPVLRPSEYSESGYWFTKSSDYKMKLAYRP